MGFVYEERSSDSPYIESVTQGRTEGRGLVTRPAEIHSHLVVRKLDGKTSMLVVGPLTSAGVVPYTEGAELLWIKLSIGAYFPHLPAHKLIDRELVLPEAARRSFWLASTAWPFPDYDNVETWIDRLRREGLLVLDPVVDAVLQERPVKIPSRTVRHHFSQAAGLSPNQIRQIKRAYQAAALLEQGVPILDTVYEAGYFDQPHLTRSLKRWIGVTPAQIQRVRAPA